MEKRTTHKTFMQLTAGTQAVVFDLSSEDRTEVAMIHELDAFKDPITFSQTGFVYNTYQRAFDSNLHASLGVQRPWPDRTGRAVFRALAEIDLQQILLAKRVLSSTKH